MTIRAVLLSVCLLALPAFAAPALAADETVSLRNANGEEMGTVLIQTEPKGTLFTVEVKGLSEGWHGFHVHGVGDCSGEGFKSAGSHDAMQGEGHGFMAANGPHDGDLPNIWVNEAGNGKAQFFKDGFGDKDMTDKDGSALVVHEKADDYKTDPAGGSGDRIACGVISPKQE